MTYASLCDGIGAVHCAWQPLGWRCAWTSEIEPFPIAVVESRWGFPNLGDMTRITDEQIAAHGKIDLLVGGTPCQDFSVAGTGAGWTGARGTLTWSFVELVRRVRPAWLLWENVPGVLMPKHRAGFVRFLGEFAKFGYGVGWRVLDAQYFGVPQRRRRVFVVGYLGDWRPAAEVLFDPESLCGHPAPRREAGEGATYAVTERTRNGGRQVETQADLAYALDNPGAGGRAQTRLVCYGGGNTSDPIAAAAEVNAKGGGRLDFETETLIVGALQAGGTPRGHGTAGVNDQAVAAGHIVSVGYAVRRLLPVECERLQGFPDDWTLITYRGKSAADGPRYGGLGNSMAVPVMRWLGERIAAMTPPGAGREG